MIYIYFIIILFSINSVELVIRDNFKFCYGPDQITDDTILINLSDESCEPPNKSDFKETEEWKQPVHVLSRNPDKVKGIGYECSKTVTTVTTYMGFFAGRSLNINVKDQTVSREECQFMVFTNKCDANTMECDNGVCFFDGKPGDDYYWLTTWTKVGVSCRTEIKKIQAKDSEEKLFGTQCKVKDLSCLLHKSIIIWSQDIIQKCEYNWITTINNLTMIREQVLFQVITLN